MKKNSLWAMLLISTNLNALSWLFDGILTLTFSQGQSPIGSRRYHYIFKVCSFLYAESDVAIAFQGQILIQMCCKASWGSRARTYTSCQEAKQDYCSSGRTYWGCIHFNRLAWGVIIHECLESLEVFFTICQDAFAEAFAGTWRTDLNSDDYHYNLW